MTQWTVLRGEITQTQYVDFYQEVQEIQDDINEDLLYLGFNCIRQEVKKAWKIRVGHIFESASSLLCLRPVRRGNNVTDECIHFVCRVAYNNWLSAWLNDVPIGPLVYWIITSLTDMLHVHWLITQMLDSLINWLASCLILENFLVPIKAAHILPCTVD